MSDTYTLIDASGDRLHVTGLGQQVNVTIRGPYFAIRDRATLRAIIAELTRLDKKVFGPEFEEPGPPAVPENVLLYREDFIYDLPLGKVMSTAELVNAYQETDHENVKAALLYLGDSRRPDREFDLSRDDRTEAMIPDYERALMPRDEHGRYYCTVQRRR